MCLTRFLKCFKCNKNEEANDKDEENFISNTSSVADGSTDSEKQFVHPAVLAGVSKFRLSIHIPILMAFAALTLTGTPFTNQLLYQTCLSEYNYTKKECESLLGKIPKTNQTSEIENKVQPYVTFLLTVNTLITSVLPALFCLGAGPWSDKFGRRPMILLALTGFTISHIMLSVISYISLSINLNPWWFLLPSLPVAFSGSICLLVTMVYSYVCDIYSLEYRAISTLVATTIIGIGGAIGSILSGVIYDNFNMQITFFTSAIIITLALLYFAFINVESLHNVEEGSKLKGLVSTELVDKFWETCSKIRPRYHRTYIWCIIFVIVIQSFIADGQQNLFYLFLSKKLNWSLSQFNNFRSVVIITSIAICVLGSYLLMHLLKLSLVTMLFIVMSGNILESVGIALAAYSWQIYVAKIIGSFQGMGVPLLRSMLSLLATDAEIGTIFAINNSFQDLVGIGAAPLYSVVYSLTLAFDPGFYNYLNILLYIICFILIGVLFILRQHLKLPAVVPSS